MGLDASSNEDASYGFKKGKFFHQDNGITHEERRAESQREDNQTMNKKGTASWISLRQRGEREKELEKS